MSGSDPSVRRSTGAGMGGGEECAITFETTLASPDPDAVDTVRAGDLLDVESIDSPVSGVVAKVIGGPIVGAIARDILLLRRCLDRGNDYEAEVLRISGGAVTVVVRRR